ncbi:MAG: hypothetical protein KDE09_12110 [Anaerolineales bacterium]|nr:hypothetical protein [Anaerolineales bacterium]MCB8959752.1 hypothetical protein [Ardenticatenales bacterium]MCB0005704.1 hypothetical protein [Anaerolineales bacterium]MCB0012820.1 hypothetical protein [Anaerolineales bacterium]MCB0018526.1 hypothetical protein [Anaerolineales bacterium]
MRSEISPVVPAEPQQPLIKKLYVALGIILILAIAGLTIWGILYLANTFPAEIEALRDIFIILLALGSCLSGIVVVLLLVMVIRLINMLEFEIKPILEKTNETLGTVRGTTRFVSANVVQPTIRAGSYVAGIRRGLKVLFGDPDKNLPA